MGTQKSPPKLNMEDPRADTEFVPHSLEDSRTCSLGRCRNHTKDLGKVNSGTREFLINLQHEHPIQ